MSWLKGIGSASGIVTGLKEERRTLPGARDADPDVFEVAGLGVPPPRRPGPLPLARDAGVRSGDQRALGPAVGGAIEPATISGWYASGIGRFPQDTDGPSPVVSGSMSEPPLDGDEEDRRDATGSWPTPPSSWPSAC